MDYTDSASRLRLAALELCADAVLPVRLERAHAQLSWLTATDLPEALATRFDELLADIGYGADTVAEALARMNRVDQSHLAGRVVSLYGALCRYLPAEE